VNASHLKWKTFLFLSPWACRRDKRKRPACRQTGCNGKQEPACRRQEWTSYKARTFASPIRFARVAPNF